MENPTDLKRLVRELKAGAEKEAIRQVLDQTGGNRTEAARLLNISTKALLQKVRQYGLVPSPSSNLVPFPGGAGGTTSLSGD